MKTQPKVSIVIINWNGGKVFERCLQSLTKLTYSNWELLVVDNGSTDKSNFLPKQFFAGSKLLSNKRNVGFALANNQATKKARGEYLLLLNNDTQVSPNLLDVLIDKMENDPSIGVVQPKIKMMADPQYLDNAGSFMTWTGFLSHWGYGMKDTGEFNREREVFSVPPLSRTLKSRTFAGGSGWQAGECCTTQRPIFCIK